MPSSVWTADIQAALMQARAPHMPGVRGARALPAPFPSPLDRRDIWIYFVLVDRFDNPDAPPRFSWDGEHGVFQGGTLNGVRSQLDYLQELGVGALWLSPVLKNCQYEESYHGYGIQDFVAIDPRWASDPAAAKQDPALVEGELRGSVDEAHARGIYVIFDIVLNHAGDVFAYATDQGRQDALASWRDDPPYTIFWRDENGQGRPDLDASAGRSAARRGYLASRTAP